MSTETFDEETTDSGWSAWSPWKPSNTSPPTFESCRTRTITFRWKSREVTTETVYICPSDYIKVSNDECSYYWTDESTPGASKPGTTGHPSRIPAEPHVDYTYGPTTQHESEMLVKECRYYSHFHKFRGRSGLRRAGVPEPHLHSIGELRLVRGSKFSVRGGKSITNVRVNGNPVEGHTIDTADLPTGISAVEIEGEVGDVIKRYHLRMIIVAPLVFVVKEPFSAAGDEVRLACRIENHSGGDQLVRLEVSGAPEGWRAELVGDPIRLLSPKKGVSVRLRAQRWDSREKKMPEPELLPFTVQASVVGAKGTERNLAQATLYARSERDQPRREHLERAV